MDTRGNTFMNSIVGAVVILLLSYLPFTPAIGGIVTGYLEGDDRIEGGKAGVVAGLFAVIPLYLVSLFVVPVFFFAPFGVPVIPGNPILFAMVLLLIVGIYLIVFSGLGGFVGSYVADSR